MYCVPCLPLSATLSLAPGAEQSPKMTHPTAAPPLDFLAGESFPVLLCPQCPPRSSSLFPTLSSGVISPLRSLPRTCGFFLPEPPLSRAPQTRLNPALFRVPPHSEADSPGLLLHTFSAPCPCIPPFHPVPYEILICSSGSKMGPLAHLLPNIPKGLVFLSGQSTCSGLSAHQA